MVQSMLKRLYKRNAAGQIERIKSMYDLNYQGAMQV